MKRFQNILFVADKSKGEALALTKLLALARDTGAQVTVLDVLAQFPDKFHVPDADVDLEALHAGMRDERSEELRVLAATAAGDAGSRLPRVLLREGIDYIEVIRQVQDGGHDLVAKASDNNSGVVGVLFGTLDMQLLRKCPCPVFIIKPRRKISHARILAALDLADHDRKRVALNQELVTTAAAMAGIEEGSLDLLHVWHLPYEKKIRNEDMLRDTNTVSVLLKDLRTRKQQQLDRLAEEWTALGVQTHLVKGEAHVVIPRFARAQRVDLVVMGTVGRSGIAGFFIGNTAEKILYGLNCSVLALKPQGFKSPVR